MENYWEKRKEFPSSVTAVEAASSDEESDVEDASDDDDNRTTCANDASSIFAPSSPAPASHDSNDEDETPDVAYACFRAQKAAQKASFSGWQAELRSWNKSYSSKHTPDMDLCKYWAVCYIFLIVLSQY